MPLHFSFSSKRHIGRSLKRIAAVLETQQNPINLHALAGYVCDAVRKPDTSFRCCLKISGAMMMSTFSGFDTGGRALPYLQVFALHVITDIHKAVPPLEVAVMSALNDDVWQDAIADCCWPALPRPPAQGAMQIVMVQVLNIPAEGRVIARQIVVVHVLDIPAKTRSLYVCFFCGLWIGFLLVAVSEEV